MNGSLYPQPPAPPQPMNALQAVYAASGINQLRQFQAQQGLGQALGQAIRPDGSFDENTLTQAMQNPAYGIAVPQFESQVLNIRQQQLNNANAQFMLEASRRGAITDMLQAGASEPNPTTTGLNSKIANIKTLYPDIPATTLTAIASQAPTDPGGLHSWYQNWQTTAAGAQAAMQRVLGPVTGGGATTTMPLGALTAQGQGPIAVQPPLGAAASAQQRQADLLRSGDYQRSIYPLTQVLQKLQDLGPGATGPGTAGRQQFESWLQAFAPSSPVGQIFQGRVASYDELHKYLTQNMQASANRLGAGTDMQFSTAVTGNPNVDVSTMANIDLAKAGLGMQRMDQTLTRQSQGAGDVEYSNARSKLAGQLDPKAFLLPNMSAAEVAKLKKSLSPADQARLNFSYDQGVRAGVLPGVTPSAGQ